MVYIFALPLAEACGKLNRLGWKEEEFDDWSWEMCYALEDVRAEVIS